MLHVIVIVLAVLFIAGVVGAYLFLVVSDVRRTHREPLDADGRRSLDAYEQRDAQHRVNRGAFGVVPPPTAEQRSGH